MHQGRFANTGISGYQQQLRLSRNGTIENGLKFLDLGLATV
jgi:hypothetical protein